MRQHPAKICANSPRICTKLPKRCLKNIVTRFLSNFGIYGTPPSPGVYNDTNILGPQQFSRFYPGNTPWVAPACADCPGFLVLVSASSPGCHLGLGASDCSPGLAFCFTDPWRLLGSAARSSPATREKTGRTAHVFTAQGGTPRF